jgi:hypothetical protein
MMFTWPQIRFRDHEVFQHPLICPSRLPGYHFISASVGYPQIFSTALQRPWPLLPWKSERLSWSQPPWPHLLLSGSQGTRPQRMTFGDSLETPLPLGENFHLRPETGSGNNLQRNAAQATLLSHRLHNWLAGSTLFSFWQTIASVRVSI